MISEMSFSHNIVQSSEYNSLCPQEVYSILCGLKLLQEKIWEKLKWYQYFKSVTKNCVRFQRKELSYQWVMSLITSQREWPWNIKHWQSEIWVMGTAVLSLWTFSVWMLQICDWQSKIDRKAFEGNRYILEW